MSTFPNNSICIPFRPHYQTITGSITAALVLQQLEYWFQRHHSGFYKFLSIPKKYHPNYRKHDSWTEELGISEKVFRRSFDKIGIRHASKADYLAAENPFINAQGQEMYFCSYYHKPTHMTHYLRNHALTDDMLAKFAPKNAGQNSEAPKGQFANGDKGRSTINTQITPKKTTTEPRENSPQPAPEIAATEAASENPVVVPVEKPSSTDIDSSQETHPETAVLAKDDVHFNGFHENEIKSAQKILIKIDLAKQTEVLQVLQVMLLKNVVKNKIGYLQALVKSVQDESFTTLKQAKSIAKDTRVIKKAIPVDEIDSRYFNLEDHFKDLQQRFGSDGR